MDANSSQGSVPDVHVRRWRRLPRASSRPTTHYYGDRFIPLRGGRNMDIAEALLNTPTKDESTAELSPSRAAYRKLLADTMLQGRTRVLSFSNRPHTPLMSSLEPLTPTHIQPAKRRRHIPQGPEKTLGAPNILADDQLNVLDWGSEDILAIALDDAVYLWNAANESIAELVTVTGSSAPITSVSWAPDGRHLATGQRDSTVVLYDVTAMKPLLTLYGLSTSWVGSLAWNNNHLLTTGGADGLIKTNDVRSMWPIVNVYRGHDDAVCGLQWSPCGKHLASGGKDQLLNIWDISRSSDSSPLHRFNNHTAAVRGVAWCPFENNLLASGGGETDRCIKFWNVSAGTCVKSLETESEVCGLLWNKKEHELLSSHGPDKNQITVWKYPSMFKISELTRHTSSVLYMSQSPDGCTVASASDDETLNMWQINEKSTEKKAPKSYHVGPTNMYSYIR
ncbi:hypothetical protein LUZ63_008121 [Rhynchospora breviuscula]|uniref:CDC20/Fizzy WD40 domain-containing protein n=1 Tax=Rhynchospora breviuscula TaxID=2022672 RepID=A0A9Q0CSZ2_9POAL|nr:hypothetical protein LUZ63_008121 [Rhynchospora breviuscula]